jgi:hypothetical protein
MKPDINKEDVDAFLLIQPSADAAATSLAIAWAMMRGNVSLKEQPHPTVAGATTHVNDEMRLRVAKQLANLSFVMQGKPTPFEVERKQK